MLAWLLPHVTDVPQKGNEEMKGILGNWKPNVKAFSAVRGEKTKDQEKNVTVWEANFEDGQMLSKVVLLHQDHLAWWE